MPRKLTGGFIQAAAPLTDPSTTIDTIRKAAIDAHILLIEDAGRKGVQVLGLQEVFNGPYFCPSQDPWSIRRFYGSSYFVDPRGNIIAMGSEDKDGLVVAEPLP
jgi:predicted amidohydrolase